MKVRRDPRQPEEIERLKDLIRWLWEHSTVRPSALGSMQESLADIYEIIREEGRSKAE